MTSTYQHPEAIVDTAWLAEHLGDPNLRIFETTTYLLDPPEGSGLSWLVRPGREEYDAGHIPGAGFLDVQNELSDNSGPRHILFTMPPPEVLAKTLAARGIGEGTRVVLYCRTNPIWATRVWWMLRAIGFDNAAVLDGGWDKWELEGRPASTGPCEYAPASLAARPRPEVFVGKDEVLAAINDGATCTINALGAALHRGEDSRYGRVGRIPGSVNVPAAALSDPVKRTLPTPEVASEAFHSAGVEGKSRHILYCGGGIAASYDAFLMHQLGYENISIYDASMGEWARDESLPIETD